MVALTGDGQFGLPSKAYIEGYMAFEEGVYRHCNPYRTKTRAHDSWDMGYQDSKGQLNVSSDRESHDAQECV